MTEYKAKIDEFKADFDGKMTAFDRSVALETFKVVNSIGEYVSHRFTVTRAESRPTVISW